MTTETRERADKIFASLGLVVATSAGNGRYLRSELKEGFRFWTSSLSRQGCDRFGLQVLIKAVAPEMLSAVSRQLISKGFTHKESGNKTEYFRTIDFLPGGAPDVRGIKVVYEELLGIQELKNIF